MSKIEEMIRELSPELQQEVEDFVEFLSNKSIGNNKIQRKKTSTAKSLLKFAGTWSGPKEEYDAILKAIKDQSHLGSPEAVRSVMHEPPHLKSEDVDELEQEIEKGRIPINQEGVFDEVKS